MSQPVQDHESRGNQLPRALKCGCFGQQWDVVEKILRHCGLWDRPASRAPPPHEEPEQLALELEYVDTDEFFMAL